MNTDLRGYKRPESVLVVIHTVDGQVLVMRRAGSAKEAFWQSVTGSLEWGESIAAAAQRELYEETGLTACVEPCDLSVRFEIRAAALHRYAPGTRWNTEHLFRCVLPRELSITLSETEHTQFEWLPAGEAKERVWSWTNREAIQQLLC